MALVDLCCPVTPPSNSIGIRTVTSYEDHDLVSADAFLLGYMEDRNSNNIGASDAVSAIRKQLYSLHSVSRSLRIYDLGNCVQGNTIAESYSNLQKCIELLRIYDKPIVVFGGTQEAVCALAKPSFQRVSYPAVCFIDARIDWDDDTDVSSQNYLQAFYDDNPVARIIHIANQEYLSSRQSFSWLKHVYGAVMRLGDCNADITLVEPFIRDAQLVSFDMSSVRYSDNPAGQNVNGLYSEHACQCAWDAGYSPRMKTFFLSDFNPRKDVDEISAQLSAQILWHVLDGVSQRKNETMDFEDDTYQKRYLKHPKYPQDICFYESFVSQTMWIEVPIGTSDRKRIIPCSKNDYEQFRLGYVPEFWISEFMRLSHTL